MRRRFSSKSMKHDQTRHSRPRPKWRAQKRKKEKTIVMVMRAYRDGKGNSTIHLFILKLNALRYASATHPGQSARQMGLRCCRQKIPCPHCSRCEEPGSEKAKKVKQGKCLLSLMAIRFSVKPKWTMARRRRGAQE